MNKKPYRTDTKYIQNNIEGRLGVTGIANIDLQKIIAEYAQEYSLYAVLRRDNISYMSFSQDSKSIFYGGLKTLDLWDFHNKGTNVKEMVFGEEIDLKKIICYKGNLLFFLIGPYLRLASFDFANYRDLSTAENKDFTSIAISPCGKFVACAADTSLLIVNSNKPDVITGTRRQMTLWNMVINLHSDVILAVAYCPSKVKALEYSCMANRRDFKKDLYSINEGKLENFGVIATASKDKTIKILDITQEKSKTFIGHSDCVNVIEFSPDGSLLASGSSDKTIMIWDLLTGTCTKILRDHKDSVVSLAFSPKVSDFGKILASASKDHTIKIWNIDTGYCIYTFDQYINWKEEILNIQYSPDGEFLGSASRINKEGRVIEGIVKVRNIVKNELLEPELLNQSGECVIQ